MSTAIVNPNGVGVMPRDVECEVYARGGNVCAGYCYPFATLQSSVISDDSVTVSAVPGTDGYIYGNIVGGDGSLSTDARAGMFVIALQDILDGRRGRVKVSGFVSQAKVANSTTAATAIAIGSELFVQQKGSGTIPAVASYLDAKICNTGTEPKKYVGIALAALASGSGPSNGTTMAVLFDGWNGIGGAGNA